MTLGLSVGTLLLETLGVLAAAALVGALLGLRGPQRRRVAATAVAALAAALALGGAANAVSSLNDQRSIGVSASSARDHCLVETQATASIAFLHWLRQRIPARSSYWLASSPRLIDAPGGIDPLCAAFELLPRLPARSLSDAGWIIYTGTLPSAVKARSAAHDPSVAAFSPGFVLERVVRR